MRCAAATAPAGSGADKVARAAPENKPSGKPETFTRERATSTSMRTFESGEADDGVCDTMKLCAEAASCCAAPHADAQRSTVVEVDDRRTS